MTPDPWRARTGYPCIAAGMCPELDEFGEQPRGTVDALRPALGVTARNEFVSMARLGRFASRGAAADEDGPRG